jgi:UDP-glucuronate 4-epimerase
MTKILVTGAAGFIGYHLCKSLHEQGHDVYGLDNFNDYYDISLKLTRANLLHSTGIVVETCDLRYMQADTSNGWAYPDFTPDVVIHLAASVGVRHSYDNALEYINNNVVGTQKLIDWCKVKGVRKVIYASTSCVMAGNSLPWKEDEPTGHQLNAYGYTKRTNECQFMTSGLHTIGLRFFTVYGPYGRPDMALFQFANAAVDNTPIDVYNYGNMKRDFTYVDDIVAGIQIILNKIITDTETNSEIYNIGRGQQVNLMDFISEIETNFGRKIEKNLVPRHPADTLETWSDTTKLQALGWRPKTSISEGVAKFCEWYKTYYGVN